MANKEYDTIIQGIIDKQKQQNTQPQIQPQPISIADTFHLTKGGMNQAKNTGGFNTQSMYDASLKARNALLQQNYNTALSNLENAYNTNKMELDMQRGYINDNYQDSIRQIKDQTYRNLEDGKVLQANRGIMNSAMGTAQHQGMIRAGNEDMNATTRERDRMLNDLAVRINNLTQSYQNSRNTLAANFALGKTQALNQSLAEKLASDLDLYKFDTDWENRFESQSREFEHNKFMQDDQQNWQELQNNLDREQQMAIAQLNASTQLKVSQISASAQLEAARLASIDRRAAQAFIEKQWAIERQDALDAQSKADAMALYQNSRYYDPNAVVTFWDKLAPWKTKNEKATEINKAIVELSSAPDEAKKQFIDQLYTNAASRVSYNEDWFDDLIDNAKQIWNKPSSFFTGIKRR